MSNVGRIPLYTIPTRQPNADRVHFLGDMEKKLSDFEARHHTMGCKFGYNEFEIMVRPINAVEWTPELHDEFIKAFPVILYRVERQETFEKNRYSVVMLYHYIPKYVKDKWNDQCGMDIRDVRL